MAARNSFDGSGSPTRFFTALLLVMLMVFMGTSSIYSPHSTLETTDEEVPTSGRQGLSIEDECEGLKFEDLFDYDFADFKVFIGDDWATAEMDAGAFVNGSKSATVRENLDGLFEGLSGGDNGYISTDERDAVRAIGPKCIGAMDTRIGMKEGIPHRGAPDWNNLSFVEDGIGLDEIDLVPQNHPQERTCQNIGSANGCKEVPVSVTEDLQIMMFLASDQTNNVRFDQLPNSGDSNFTLALNVTNMSFAHLELNFPLKQGLRLANYSIQDTVSNSDGSIVVTENTELSAPEALYLPDGRLRVNQVVTYTTSEYPIQRDLFLDFTTMAPETNEAPEWTSNAPQDGTVIPMMGGMNMVVSGEKTAMWATDDSGWGMNCVFAESGWTSSLDGEGNLIVEHQNSPSPTSDAECYVVDPFGEQSVDSRNWTFGEVFTATALLSGTGDSIEFTLTPTGLVNEMSISAHAHQSNAMGQMRTTTVATENAILSLPLDGLSPGDVMVMGQAQGSTMLDLDFMLNFGLIKASLPPLISVSKNLDGLNATWEANGLTFTLKGDVLDPDGEEVTLTLLLCGYTTNDFLRDGSGWEINVNIVSCSSQNPPVTAYDIVLTATDDSGSVTTYTVFVPDPYASQDDTGRTDSGAPSEAEEGLPSLSMLATLSVTLLGAAFVGRRRTE